MSSPRPHLPLNLADNDTRFTLELEFITLLSNPYYIHYLASTPSSSFPHIPFPGTAPSTLPLAQEKKAHNTTQPILHNPDFIRYLTYLSYWRLPQYVKYLRYPDLSLKHLRLLQSQRFREDVCGARSWEIVVGLVEDATSEKREAPAGEDGGGKLEGEAEGERGVVMAQG